MFRHSSLEHDVGQGLDHILAVQLTSNDDGQTFPSVLINCDEIPKRFPITSTIHDEIMSPYMVRVLRPQSDAGTV